MKAPAAGTLAPGAPGERDALLTSAAPSPAARRKLGHPEVFAALFGLSFLAARFLPLLELGYACPFKALTGAPCPTCGMTHAFVALAHGDLGHALAASPAGALLGALAWTFVLVNLGRLLLGRELPRPGPRAARVLARAGALALVANWAFLLLSRGA